MIDSEKLTLAYELAEKLSKDYPWGLSLLISWTKYGISFTLNLHDGHPAEWFDCMDGLLAKLQELTQEESQPKYQIGDKVWVLGLKGGMRKVTIAAHYQGMYLIAGSDAEYSEDELYPSKQSLIEAQIEYWTNLREPVPLEGMTPKFEGAILGFDNSDKQKSATLCQHESNGQTWKAFMRPELGKIYECMKCGEFYNDTICQKPDSD